MNGTRLTWSSVETNNVSDLPLMPGLCQHHSKWKVTIRHGAEPNVYIETKKDGDFDRNEE
ncbi:hypothetical protein Plhal710r2_c033g0121901 [Plasmopara halstedii]